VDTLPFKQVDVFTQKPFLGNPVAVVLQAEGLTADEMQRIAAWTNLSETTFVLPSSSTAADYRLRIFTPKQEMPFAGHPTIGSAHAVLESGFAAPHAGRLRQECLAGIIELDVEKNTNGERIFVHAPAAQISAVAPSHSRRLLAALGIPANSASPPFRVDVGVVWLVADAGDSKTLAGIEPGLDEIRKVSAETRASGVTVFGRAQEESARMHVRSFAPILGVAEDPVCGSGNASVAALLVQRGLIGEFGTEYLSRQGMAVGRAGEVSVSVAGGEIRIGGFALTCIDGRIRIK
jgi:PhzF family phenazine biosynthesis protein